MLKKYFYLLTTCLLVVLFTACSEDSSSTGSGSGSGGGGSTQECSLSSEDLEGIWKLQSSASVMTLTTNTNIGVLDSWSEVATPMSIAISTGDADPVTESLNYLHVSANDEKILFFLSEESYWNGWGNKYIQIECDVTDLTNLNSCSSFMSHMDGENSVHVNLPSLSSVEWVETPSSGTYELTVPAFSEQTESGTVAAEASVMLAGTRIINVDTPLEVGEIDTKDVWDQSYMTFNSDGTVSHYNTLACDLITPENDNDCYIEGCAPTMTDDILTGCSNVDCSSLTTQDDCFAWNECVWLDNTCLDYESNDVSLADQWSFNCNNGIPELVLTHPDSDISNGFSQFFDVLLSEDSAAMSISISQPYCDLITYYGYDCDDAYSGIAEDFYGLSDNQIESAVISTSEHYIISEMPTMRSTASQLISNPILRPTIINLFRK